MSWKKTIKKNKNIYTYNWVNFAFKLRKPAGTWLIKLLSKPLKENEPTWAGKRRNNRIKHVLYYCTYNWVNSVFTLRKPVGIRLMELACKYLKIIIVNELKKTSKSWNIFTYKSVKFVLVLRNPVGIWLMVLANKYLKNSMWE